jgi:hypothetical protein
VKGRLQPQRRGTQVGNLHYFIWSMPDASGTGCDIQQFIGLCVALALRTIFAPVREVAHLVRSGVGETIVLSPPLAVGGPPKAMVGSLVADEYDPSLFVFATLRRYVSRPAG